MHRGRNSQQCLGMADRTPAENRYWTGPQQGDSRPSLIIFVKSSSLRSHTEPHQNVTLFIAKADI